MRFRPCIDIHNGKVKQIVGSSLRDERDRAENNFVSEKDAGYYADLYRDNNMKGGHIIILNPPSSEFYEGDISQAGTALSRYPEGMMIGGGINADNAPSFLEMGASHVIVTSYVFSDGKVDYKNLEKMAKAVGEEQLVLDLSCRKKDGRYVIVTDRWQKYTDVELCHRTLDELSAYCAEFLVHAVDVEGKCSGIERELVPILGSWAKIPVCYAGGVSSLEDIEQLRILGNDKLDFSIGSALDIFGGKLSFEHMKKFV